MDCLQKTIVAAMTFVKSLYSTKKLVVGTLEKEFTKASNASVWGRFYIKEVHEGVFKHLVLNCTINRGACKRTCLTGALIQNLTHFYLGFLELFLGRECKITHLVITFDRDMLHPQNVAHI